MNKLNKNFLNVCNRANCCFDDFVLLPPEGDVGIDEYIEYKAGQIKQAKSIYSPLSQHMLILSYPSDLVSDQTAFNCFFESPSVVALNDRFSGCFGIDVTDYLGRTDSPAFLNLLTYIGSHTDIVFVLFAYTSDKEEADKMFNILCKYDKFRKMSIALPSPETLCDYTLDVMHEAGFSATEETTKFLLSHFKNTPSGFDAAEWLVLYLQNNDYDGTVEHLRKLADEAERLKTETTEHPSDRKFGFREEE